MRSPYHEIRIGGGDTAKPLALQRRLNFISPYLTSGARFLDCGCGAGEYVFVLVESFGLDARGIEFEAQKVEIGRRHPKYGSRVSKGDIQFIESEAAQWDYAMVNEVLEHVPDDCQALAEIHRVLKPGGYLFVFSPNRWYPFETHATFLKNSGGRVPHWVPLVPYIPVGIGRSFLRYPARNYWQSELRQIISSKGFDIQQTGYIWQTFEDISGRQPALIRFTKPVLRKISNLLSQIPLARRFGVSQALVCRKR